MNTESSQQPQYPPVSTQENTNPFYQEPPPPPPSSYPDIQSHKPEHQSSSSSVKYVKEDHTLAPHTPQEASAAPPSSSAPPADDEKWGTCVMGTPAVPTVHPDNKKAAFWGASGEEAQLHHHPYLQYCPIDQTQRSNTASAGSSSTSSPMDSILHTFNSWSNKAETMATNIWHNLKTAPSVPGAAWAKVNLRARAITGGGFETLYKQTFTTYPNEVLKKSFACYLSTTTGPVAGTLYLSNLHAAFCSDRPLSFTAPSGQVTWSYYKVLVPLGKIGAVNPVVMRENATEKYVQIVTLEGHDFWFMGFVNYEKACRHLTEGVSNLVATGVAVPPPDNAAVHP